MGLRVTGSFLTGLTEFTGLENFQDGGLWKVSVVPEPAFSA
jgi:hypothetical protein